MRYKQKLIHKWCVLTAGLLKYLFLIFTMVCSSNGWGGGERMEERVSWKELALLTQRILCSWRGTYKVKHSSTVSCFWWTPIIFNVAYVLLSCSTYCTFVNHICSLFFGKERGKEESVSFKDTRSLLADNIVGGEVVISLWPKALFVRLQNGLIHYIYIDLLWIYPFFLL